MPRGSAPGERRGGRQKGGLNKSTVAAKDGLKLAMDMGLAELGPDALDTIMPAQLMLVAMRAMAKVGLYPQSLSVAEKAAPYFNAKLAPLVVEPPQEHADEKAKRLHDAMREMRNTVVKDEQSTSPASGPDSHDETPEGGPEPAL